MWHLTRTTCTVGQYHMVYHTSHTTYGASPYGELRAMTGTIPKIAGTLPTDVPYTERFWFLVDITMDTHLLLEVSLKPVHKAN